MKLLLKISFFRQVLPLTAIVHSSLLYYSLFLNVWFWFVIVFGSDGIMKIPVESLGWSPLVLKRFVLVQWRETRGESPVSLTQLWSDGGLRSSSESRQHKPENIFWMSCMTLVEGLTVQFILCKDGNETTQWIGLEVIWRLEKNIWSYKHI